MTPIAGSRLCASPHSPGSPGGSLRRWFAVCAAVLLSTLTLLAQSTGSITGRVQNAATGANRAAVLTQRLLAFARRQPLAPRAVDVNRLIAGMSELLHRTLGEQIEIETVAASGLWRTEVDPNQLEMAILNLAVNARDAMPDGGRLTLETTNTHLDHDYVAQHPEVAAGQYVAICVSDTGSGMDPATIARAFEPFFTTKDVGKGTGLGLDIARRIVVERHGGEITIDSRPGETALTVRLPLASRQLS